MSNEDETQPSGRKDARAEPPEQPKTKQIPAASPVEILLTQIRTAMDAGFRETNANIDLVTGDVKSLKADVRNLQEWKLVVEKQPTVTSERVRAIADGYTSQVDLQHEAALSAEIIKNRERDRKIADTHALAEAAGIELAKQSAELAKQSRAMGIGVAGLKWVVSKEGRATMTQLAILIGVLYGTLKGAGVVK